MTAGRSAVGAVECGVARGGTQAGLPAVHQDVGACGCQSAGSLQADSVGAPGDEVELPGQSCHVTEDGRAEDGRDRGLDGGSCACKHKVLSAFGLVQPNTVAKAALPRDERRSSVLLSSMTSYPWAACPAVGLCLDLRLCGQTNAAHSLRPLPSPLLCTHQKLHWRQLRAPPTLGGLALQHGQPAKDGGLHVTR